MKQGLIPYVIAGILISLFFMPACKGNGLGKGRIRVPMEDVSDPGTVFAVQSYTSTQARIGDRVICPVNGPKFIVTEKSFYADIGGKRYYVSCSECLDLLKADPDRYLKK